MSESICANHSIQEYHCEVADSFQTALIIMDYNDYDCILLDINLPDGDGLKILQNLKEDKKRMEY